jgi:hypothetical protein
MEYPSADGILSFARRRATDRVVGRCRAAARVACRQWLSLPHAPLLRLWAGQTVSMLGSQVTALALPLTAVLALGSSRLDMGVLGAAQQAPWLLLSLVAGATVDRLPRRPLMVACDLARAVLLASVPVAALAGVLRMEQLYVVAFAATASPRRMSASSATPMPGASAPGPRATSISSSPATPGAGSLHAA